MNETVQVRGVQIGLLVPGGGWQDDVAVQGRAVHAEIQVDHQVELSLGRLFVPDNLRDGIPGQILGDRVGVRAEVVFEEVFVALGAGQQGVAPPDVPDARPILRGVRVLHGEPQLPRFELLDGVVDDLLLAAGARGFGFADEFQRVAIELGIEGKQAATDRADLQVHRVSPGQRGRVGVDGHGVVVGERLLVAPLVGVDVVERPPPPFWSLTPRNQSLAKAIAAPRFGGGQLFLPT